MNYGKKVVVPFSAFLCMLTTVTSTQLSSSTVKSIMDFLTEINHLGEKLKEVETLQSKWLEAYSRDHTNEIMSKVETLRSAVDDCIQNYKRDDFDYYAKISDVNYRLRTQALEIKMELQRRSELSHNFPSVSSLLNPVIFRTDFTMWALWEEIDFLDIDGMIFNMSESDDSTLSVDVALTQVLSILMKLTQLLESYQILRGQTLEELKSGEPTLNNIKRLEEMGMEKELTTAEIEAWLNRAIDPPVNQANKIRMFLQTHGFILGQLVNRVKNKQKAVLGLFEKLEAKESGTFAELLGEIDVDMDALVAIKQLADKLKRTTVSRLGQSADADLNNNSKNEL